jgi:hypothetical protein
MNVIPCYLAELYYTDCHNSKYFYANCHSAECCTVCYSAVSHSAEYYTA